jgi:hypothetical protein
MQIMSKAAPSTAQAIFAQEEPDVLSVVKIDKRFKWRSKYRF